MILELKEVRVLHQLWIRRKFDTSDIEHMLCMFYTIHWKTGPDTNVVMKEMYIDGDKYYPVLHVDCPATELPFMKCIVDMLLSVIKSYTYLIKDYNYANYKLCELLQIEFNKKDFETLTGLQVWSDI